MLSRLSALGRRLGGELEPAVSNLFRSTSGSSASTSASSSGPAGLSAGSAAAARTLHSSSSGAASWPSPLLPGSSPTLRLPLFAPPQPSAAAAAASAGPTGAAAAAALARGGGGCGGAQLQQARGFQLMPRRIKHRKAFKSLGFNDTIVPNTRQLAWGKFGIRAMEHARVPARTIEAARRVLRRAIGKAAPMWIRMTPNVPVSSKPAEVRMGKGKGAVEYWAAPVRPGQIIFEFDRLPKKAALTALAAAAPKLPMRVGFVEWS